MSWLRRVAVTGALAPLLACQSAPGADPPAAPDERFSYALGARLGDDLRNSSHTLDREQLLRGVEDGLAGSPALSEEEITAVSTYAKSLQQ